MHTSDADKMTQKHRERSHLDLAPAAVSLVLDIMLLSAVPVLVFPFGASCSASLRGFGNLCVPLLLLCVARCPAISGSGRQRTAHGS